MIKIFKPWNFVFLLLFLLTPAFCANDLAGENFSSPSSKSKVLKTFIGLLKVPLDITSFALRNSRKMLVGLLLLSSSSVSARKLAVQCVNHKTTHITDTLSSFPLTPECVASVKQQCGADRLDAVYKFATLLAERKKIESSCLSMFIHDGIDEIENHQSEKCPGLDKLKNAFEVFQESLDESSSIPEECPHGNIYEWQLKTEGYRDLLGRFTTKNQQLGQKLDVSDQCRSNLKGYPQS